MKEKHIKSTKYCYFVTITLGPRATQSVTLE